MIQWNAEKQIAIGFHFHRGRLIDWGVMFGRRNPTGLRLSAGILYDLMHDLHAIRTRLWRAGKGSDGSRTVVPQSQPQHSRIAALARRRGTSDMVESYQDGDLFLREARTYDEAS